MSAPFPFSGHEHPDKKDILLPPHFVPADSTFPEPTFPLFPLQNPTMPTNAPLDPQSAIAAFQQSLQSVAVAALSQCPDPSSIPPALDGNVESQFYRSDSAPKRKRSSKIHELSLRAPRNRNEEVLVDKWSIKLAMSSLDSELINGLSDIWRHRVRDELDIKWQDIENFVRSKAAPSGSGAGMKNDGDSKSFEFNVSDQSVYDAVITDLITQCDAEYLSEVRSTMSTLDITQSVGMMKGIMDGLRDRIKMASMRYPDCTTDAMRDLFEVMVLPTWCSLLTVATNEIRDALRRYLCDEAFYPYVTS